MLPCDITVRGITYRVWLNDDLQIVGVAYPWGPETIRMLQRTMDYIHAENSV